MKTVFVMAYGIVAALLVCTVIRVPQKKEKISRYMIAVMITAAVSSFASMVQLWSMDERIVNVAYCFFFSTMDWMLVFLLLFVDEYCRINLEKYVKPYIWILISAVDTVSLFLNPFLGHAYVLRKIQNEYVEYLSYTAKIPFQIHLGWSYLLVGLIFLFLAQRSYQEPKMYKRKYMQILAALVLVVVFDAICMWMKMAVDLSVLGFPIAALVIYHYAIEYVPRMLVSSTLLKMVDQQVNGVVIYNRDLDIIYANPLVKKMLGDLVHDKVHFKEIILVWCKENYQDPYSDFVYDWARERDGEKQYLKIQHQRLLDEQGRLLGGFIEFQERTKEVQELLLERFAASHDHLTGLYNREYFFDQVERYLRTHTNEVYLMICTDIRNFKMINDVFGEKTADQLLVDMADAIRKQATPTMIYGRLVNDQFAIFMRKREYREMRLLDGQAEALRLAEDVTYPLVAYMGVYEIDDINLPVSLMCDRAMMALNTIKGDYQMKVAYYDAKIRKNMLREQELVSELDHAIETGQIQLYLQPQISAEGKCKGGEALVRWQHPQKGLMMPGAFIEIFEKNGMIVRLDLFIWETACKLLKKWANEGYGDRYISVNISPKDFFFVDIYKEFTKLVDRYKINPKNLKLEITETAIMHNLPKQLALIDRLRKFGFAVEMDDFGSGYSSLNMLKDIHVDVLKLDMAFLRKSEDEERSRTILRMVIAMSKELHMPVITEGVETNAQVEFLKSVGCDMFQGYFFAKPMPVEHFEDQYLRD